jgi:hypothetical protein
MSPESESAVHGVEPAGVTQTDEELGLEETRRMVARVRSVYPALDWESYVAPAPDRVGLCGKVSTTEAGEERVARFWLRVSITPQLDGNPDLDELPNLTGLWKLSMQAHVSGHAPGVPRATCRAQVAFRWGSIGGPEGLVELMAEGTETLLNTLGPTARSLRAPHTWRRHLHSPLHPEGQDPVRPGGWS